MKYNTTAFSFTSLLNPNIGGFKVLQINFFKLKKKTLGKILV